MKSINATDLLRFNNTKPFLFGALFSRAKIVQEAGDEYFCCYTVFKVSKALLQYDFVRCANELAQKYNKDSGYDNWMVYCVNPDAKEQQVAVELRFHIKNDGRMDLVTFNNLVYKKLMKCDWLHEEGLNENKKSFVRGYMETRGSIDLTRVLIAQDYYYNNLMELTRILLFPYNIGIPSSYLNFNPREMQPNSKEKATQFRMNLFWYAQEIGFSNKYKADVFASAYSSQIIDSYCKNGIVYFIMPEQRINDDIAFIKMLNYFSKNIYGQELNEARIRALRNQLGFNNRSEDNTKPKRNRTLTEIFDDISEDKCALCGTTETFTKGNGRQGFQIHHFISSHNGHEFDNVANFVKLCDTCHGSLKKSRAIKSEQVEAIITMLHQNSQLYDYVSTVLGISNINKLAEAVFGMLG